MFKKILAVSLFVLLFVGCAANSQLQTRVNELEKEKENLVKSQNEYKKFLNEMYSKIEETASEMKNNAVPTGETQELEKIQQENQNLKTEIEKHRKFISDMYSLIEQQKN